MGKKWVCLISAFLVLGPVWAVKATVTPIGWWKLDEKTGTTAADASPNKNNGTLVNGPTWAAGQIDGALEFDGTNDYVNLPIGPLISTLKSTSLTIWANFQSGGSWTRIWDIGSGETVNMFLTPAQGTAGTMRFAITNSGNGAESQLTAPAILAAGWHHVAVVINGDTRNMQLFLDGVSIATGTAAVLPANLGNTTQNWLGRSQYAADGYYHGLLDDFRIFDRPLAQDEIQKVMKGVGYGTAGEPRPADGATDIPRDVTLIWGPGEAVKAHDVYLGTALADVTNADRTNPRNVLVSQGQDANSYTPPVVLELGKTYYWRIDEVNATSAAIVKGDVWSFTVEPYSYPIQNVTATASSAVNNMGPEKTVDGSGLNAAGEHSTSATDMWLSGKGTQPAWIQYAFDKAYKLDKMLVWNSNQAMESILGLGTRDVTVEYSTDGTTWTTMGDFEFAEAPGLASYTADTTVSFGGAAVKAVKLTIKSNWGGLLPQYGLSEVRFLAVPVFAREPNPASGATGVDPQLPLGWRAGREAVSHEVYVSTDQQKVTDGTAPVGTVSDTQYAAPIALGQNYYWKVTEVNNAMTPSSWDGDVWSFTTASSITVDDFESYTDKAGGEIFTTWVDGWGTTTNGATVGYAQAPFAEQVLVHGGKQSMPLTYSNAGGALTSEAERTFDPPQDWTQYGITTLVIWFRGDANNTPAPLYAKINGTKVLFNNGAAGTAFPLWKQWNINLVSLGISLKSVKTLTLGVGDGKTSSSGMIFVDDILLYASAPQPVAAVDPGTNGLVLLYAMEGNTQDTSGKGNNGTASGNPAYGTGPNGYGKALTFDGLDDYVTLPIGSLLSSLSNITVATWVNFSGTGGGWQRIWDFGSGQTNYMFLTPAQGTTGAMTFAIRTDAIAEKRFVAPTILPTGWHHTAVVIDGAAMTATLYLDGTVVSTSSVAVLPRNLGVTTQNWIGRSQFPADAFYNGMVDDFRIYNRAMSGPEVRYLAGDR